MTRHLVIALLMLALAGCGKKSFKNANDDLRAERQQLQKRVAELETELQNRLGEIESLRGQLQTDGELPGADQPVFSAVKFDRYTGPVDTDGDGRDDLLRLYVKTLDHRGRMLPVAARANVQAVDLTPDQPPDLYLEHVWEPRDFDATYRTGLTGTHYTLEFPLDDRAPEELTVKLTLTGAAGEKLTAQEVFRINRPAAATAAETSDP